MGHRTSISDYEFERAWTTGPEADGVDIEVKAKKVEAEDKPAPTKSSAAKTKAK